MRDIIIELTFPSWTLIHLLHLGKYIFFHS